MLNLLLTNFNFLFSPFEGFKIASWNQNIFTLNEDIFFFNEPLWLWNVSSSVSSSFLNDLIWFVSNDGLLISLAIFILFFVSFQFFGSDKSSTDSSTFSEVLIIFLILITFTFLGQSLFFYSQILEGNSLILSSAVTESFFLDFFFNKDLWGFFLILLFFFLLSSGSLSNLTLFPKGDLDHFSNSFYTFSLDLFSSTLELRTEKEVQNFQEFFWKVNAIFGFIFLANSIGMIPFSTTITSNLTNTFFIAFTVFFVVIGTMVFEKGFTHFLELFLPSGTPLGLIPILVPLELFSYSFRLVSLSVRLFANMFAGHTLMKVFSGFSWSLLLVGGSFTLIHYLPVLILFALTLLELGVAAIQSYVFAVLSLLYIRDIFAGH